MIREPAIEIINYLKNLDLTLPAYRFVLCKKYYNYIFVNSFYEIGNLILNLYIKKGGNQNGTGKRSTLFHLLHYCYKDDWLIIHNKIM